MTTHVISSPSTSPSTITTAPAEADRADPTARLLLKAHNTRDADRRRQIQDEIIHANMALARSIAHRYRHRGVSTDDLEQVAYLGLVYAVRNFDMTRGDSFLSYAVPTIRGHIRKHFRDKGWTIRPTRRLQELQAQIGTAREVLSQKLGRSPRPDEVAAHLNVDLDDVVEALSIEGCFQPASLDTPLRGEGSTATLGDLLDTHTSSGLDEAEARLLLAPAIRCLSDRDRAILRMRFFEQCTQTEIAAQIGVTQMQISRILSRIFRQLRSQIDDASQD